jgi:hypothetical protein
MDEEFFGGNMRQSSHKQRALPQSNDHIISVLLEIQGEEAQGAMRLPAIIQNASDGQLILRLSHPLPDFMRESLINLPANLYLAISEEQGIVETSGKVAWLKVSSSGFSQTLGVQLSQPNPKLQTLLRRKIIPTQADIQELWERWDTINGQVNAGSEALNYHIGLALMVGGIVLNLAGPKSLILVSNLFMLLGGLVAGVKNLWPIRLRRARSI